jgi:hypothetical protein
LSIFPIFLDRHGACFVDGLMEERTMPQIHGMADAMRKVRNFHVPLPADLYRRLRLEAARSNVPATELVRDAIRDALKQRQRAAVEAAIETYARAMAGTDHDLDEELEAAGIEHLLAEERRRR